MSEFLVGFSYEPVIVSHPEDGHRDREAIESTLNDVLDDSAYPLIGQSLSHILRYGRVGNPYDSHPETQTQSGWGHKYLFGTSNVAGRQLGQDNLPYDSLLYVEASEFNGRSYSFIETAKWVRKGMPRIAGLSDVGTFLERSVFQNVDDESSDPFIEVPVNNRTWFASFENSNMMTFTEKEHADALTDLSLPKGLLDLLLSTTHGWHILQVEERHAQLLRQQRKD